MTGLSYGVGFLLGAGMVALVFSAAALAAARSSVEDLAAKDFLVVAAPAAIISGLWVVAILYCCRHFPFGAAFLFGAGLVNLVALLFCIPYFLDREERFYWKTEFLGWMWILANFGPAVPAGLWMVCALFLYHRFAWSGVAGLVGVSCLILLVARLCRPQRPGLLDAVESGDMKVVQAVFDRGGVSAQADEAALCQASAKGHTDIARLLLGYGKNANEHVPPFDPAEPGSVGTTALVEAARAGHTEILRLLLEYRAEVDLHADNGSGATALIEALRNNYLEGAKILLAHGASVHEKNARGETAIFFLMQNLASAAPETRAEIDQILRTAGVDPEQGRSPAGEDSP